MSKRKPIDPGSIGRPIFHYYWDGKGKCRLRVKAVNGEIIMPNESHNSQADAERARATIAAALAHPNPKVIKAGPKPEVGA